jgi:PAS domain S-box-containing protein
MHTPETSSNEITFRELTESIQDGLISINRDWKIVFINARAARNGGQEPEELIGRNLWEAFPKLEGTILAENYRRVMRERTPVHFEMPGTYRQIWYNVSIYPSTAGITVYWQDITDRKLSELALQESQKRLSDFFESTQEHIYALDREWKYIYANQHYCDTRGIDRNALIGKNYWEVNSRYIGTEFEGLIRQAMEERIPVRFRAGGRYTSTWFDLSVYPTQEGITVFAQDRTDEFRAEQALRKSEAYYRLLFESMAEAFFIVEPIFDSTGNMVDYRFIDANPSAERFVGKERAEIVGRTSAEALGRPNPEANQIIARVAMTGKPEREERYTSRIGRWHESHVYPHENGQIAIVSSDMTERKQAEDALREANNALIEERNRLLGVMEALPVGVVILDSQGGILHVNREYEAVWGGPPPVTQSVADYGAYQAWWVDTGLPLKPEEWASALAVQKGETVTGQFVQIQRFDGRRAFVLNSGAPIRNANGEITGSAVAIMDITPLIETENALRESQERFRVAVSTAPILVYACDRELRYTWIYNPLRGFRVEDVLGKRDDEVLPPEAAMEMVTAKQKALDTGRGGMQEVKVPLNGENTYYILATDPIRDQQGNVTGLTCSAIDITEQKRLQAQQQEQAIQIEVQRRLSEQREQDRYAIARDLHDGPIQTLSSTMFQLQMIKEVFPDLALQKELSQLGVDIKGTIHELRDLLNELRPPALIQFGFSKVARMLIEDFRERYPGIEIELEVVEDDTFLSKDIHLPLFRIFQAGINNIVRHSDANKAWVVFKFEQDCFHLEIRDNGKGFDLPKDFSHLPRHGHYGLVGMKERAEAIGAAFSISSAPGEGTKIMVSGPCSGKNFKII